MVFLSQLMCYARVCSKYDDFLFRESIPVSKLFEQGYSSQKLQSTFLKVYGHTDHHADLVKKIDTSVSPMKMTRYQTI